MYKLLYKLESRPFEPQPDPSFLWLGGKHREALSVLQDGILDNLGFVLLTGAAGTGKTTLIKELARGFGSDVVWTVISDPTLERIDFYNKIGMGFGIEKKFISKVQFLIQFSHFLNKTCDADKKVVLFIDDCHLLSQNILEDLHLLSNIEKADTKLIDIFFVGQPQFNEMLARPKNKAVRQRLGLKARLAPLGRNETVDYINHRLKTSGNVEKIFSTRAFQAIHQYSQGVPRFINMICEKALQAGSLQGEKSIDHKNIMECVQKLKLTVCLEPDELISLPAEEKQVEHSRDKSNVRDSGSQAAAVVLTGQKKKRRVWLFSALSFLMCIGLGFYFFSPKREIPLIIVTDTSVTVKDAEVTSVTEGVTTPGTVVLAKESNTEDTDTIAGVQKETEFEGMILDGVYDETIPGKEQQAAETAQLETDKTAAEQASEDVAGVEKMPEIEESVVEPVESVVEPEPEVLPVVPPMEPGRVVLELRPGSVRLTVDADRVFTEFVDTLLQYPDAKVLVKGFVSSDNDSPGNTQLSEERAASVRELLVKHGVTEAHIEIRGMGIQDPIGTNNTSAGRLKNRRVEIEVIDDGV